MGDVFRIGLIGLTAAVLSGCGLATQTVGATSAAALAPVANIVQSANVGLQTLDHTATTLAPTIKSATTTVQQSTRTMREIQAASVQQPRYIQTPRIKPLSKETRDAIEKAKKAPQPDIQVLPDETLAKLSEDQRGLQNAAQKAALTSAVGETIYWDFEGVQGSVLTKDESNRGDLKCRTFEQSVTIAGTDYSGLASACLNEDSGKWRKAF